MKSFFIFIAFAFFLVFTHPILAASVPAPLFSFQITPTSQYITLHPKDKSQQNITVKNNSSIAMDAYIYVRDFSSIDTKGDIQIYQDMDQNAGIESWIVFQNLPSTLLHFAPHETKTIPYTIIVPPTAYSGTHSSIIFIQPTLQTTTSNGASIAGRVGSNLIISISNGTIKPSSSPITLSTFSLNQQYPWDTPIFSVLVQNSGSFLAPIQGNILIHGLRKGSVIALDATDILPHATRSISAHGKTSIFSTFLPYGYDTAKISITNTLTKQTLTKTISFLYIPIPIIFTSILFLLLILVFIRVFLLRKR